MGLVYLPTFTHKNQPNVGKYSIPMDPMGIILDFETPAEKCIWTPKIYRSNTKTEEVWLDV